MLIFKFSAMPKYSIKFNCELQLWNVYIKFARRNNRPIFTTTMKYIQIGISSMNPIYNLILI